MGALIARVEGASGPDRDLNYALLMALGWSRDDGYAVNPDGNRVMSVPDYTASLDAAMTLVPEGCSFGMEAYSPDHNTLGWTVHIRFDANLKTPNVSALACTFPLALSAAALKARAATMGGSDD